MHANVGDWLIAQSRTDHAHARRAEILEVGKDGLPPFTVRWTDDGHEAIVFPGPDASVVTSEELAEIDKARAARALATQAEINAARH